jgi:hypothetical protein
MSMTPSTDCGRSGADEITGAEEGQPSLPPRHLDSYAERYTHGLQYADRYADAERHADALQHADRYADPERHADGHQHLDRHADTDGNAGL